MKRILCALCFSLVGWQALAGEVDDSLKRIDTAMQKSITEKGGAPNEMSGNPNSDTLMLYRIRENIKANNINNAIETLRQWDTTRLSNEAKKAAKDLDAALCKEQEARIQATAAQVNDVVKRATEAVKTAKAAADLDAVVSELGTLKSQHDGQSFNSRVEYEEAQKTRRQLENSLRFASNWQDYLAAKALGNADRVQSILRDILRMDVLLLPRSEILAKTQESFSEASAGKSATEPTAEVFADGLIAKTQRLEEMSGLLTTLRKANDEDRNKRSSGWGNLNRYTQELAEMDHCYHEFQMGFPVNTNIFKSIGNAPSSLLPLKNQLILYVLPRFINAPEGLKPKAKETVDDYLNRVVDEAKEQGDVDLALRARLAQRRIQQHEYRSSIENDVANNTQAAKNQEAAGQYVMAVLSYQGALKTGSDMVPVKWIVKRLDEIKKNHPTEYKEGMERILNQVAPLPVPNTAAPEPTPDTKSTK